MVVCLVAQLAWKASLALIRHWFDSSAICQKIEVKGYETDLDKAKWKYFTEKLIVLRRKEIGELDEWFKSAVC